MRGEREQQLQRRPGRERGPQRLLVLRRQQVHLTTRGYTQLWLKGKSLADVKTRMKKIGSGPRASGDAVDL